MQFIFGLQGVELHHVPQGLFGAPSSKPTGLLALNMPAFAQHLASRQLTDRLPSQASIGKDCRGRYLTARLKEYPPGLCRGIAWAICTQLAAFCAEPIEMSNSFLDRCRSMQTGFGQHFGPDYAG
eukprot:Skav217393  [mRNA]  locus=scaffold532:463620:463994:- [translate_table: standard]